jgi:DNA-binding PadR family transcriptional regulator
MSSIRLFILGALADEGEMHGHQLRQLAEKEHIDMWTDITVGALYGAIKRLAAEELIQEARVEREGSYPERQVWRITEAGSIALASLRRAGLREIVIKPDPFDLAISRLDKTTLDEIPLAVEARLSALRTMIVQEEAHVAAITKYLTQVELLVMRHRAERIRAEISWHEELLRQLPDILEDERSRSTSLPATDDEKSEKGHTAP